MNIGASIESKFRNSYTRSYGHGIACRCEICNCGSHRCPPLAPHLRPYSPSSLQTHNQSSYPGHSITSIPTRDQHAPRSTTTHLSATSGPFSSSTSHRSDFVEWKDAQPSRPFHNFSNTDPLNTSTSTDREFTSEHHRSYDGKKGEKRALCRPSQRHTAILPFEGMSTTRDDFKKWEGIKPSTPFKDNQKHLASAENRDFYSESSSKFTWHPTERRASFVPSTRVRPHVPFEASTTNSEDYPHWKDAQPARLSVQPSTTEPRAYEKDTRDFTTINASEYQHKQIERTPSCAPKHNTYHHTHSNGVNQPFIGETSHSASYKPHTNVERTRSFKQSSGTDDIISNSTNRHKDDRDFNTENRHMYARSTSPIERTKSCIPPTRHREQDLKFEGNTTNKSDYKKWENARPAERIRYDEELKAGSNGKDNRDFYSESATKFHWHSGAKPAQPFVPTTRVRTNVPFEGVSTTTADFVKHPLQVCPAQDLTYGTRKAEDGHLIYTKTAQGWAPHP